jgi:NADH-quinone oxidoreductase subunit D
MACGARLLYNYNWVGGVSHDLPEGWTDKARQFLGEFAPVIDELDDLLSLNKIFTDRTATVGIIPPELAVGYALSGPNLRGSGIKWDVRREAPYCGYEKYDFEIPVGQGRFGPIGSCWDRYYVRVEEMRQSVRILTRRSTSFRPRRRSREVPKRVKPNPGEACARTETPREARVLHRATAASSPIGSGRSPCFVSMSLPRDREGE